jgi:hypothetical protein
MRDLECTQFHVSSCILIVRKDIVGRAENESSPQLVLFLE